MQSLEAPVELDFKETNKNIILPYFKNLKKTEIDNKLDENDFVTLADKKAEEEIKKQQASNCYYNTEKVLDFKSMITIANNKYNIEATPSIIINGRKLDGIFPLVFIFKISSFVRRGKVLLWGRINTRSRSS